MRIENWETKLAESIHAHINYHFEYGTSDCGVFACNILKEITGVDYYKGFRSKYKTRKGLLRVIAKEGSLKDLVSKVLQTEPKPPRYAMRGDPVLYVDEISKEECLGICIGHLVIAPKKQGLGTFSLLDSLFTWNT